LGDRLLKLGGVEIGQFLLSEGQVLAFTLPQPGTMSRAGLGRMSMSMVYQSFPGRSSLTVATAECGEVILAEMETQFLTDGCKGFSLVKPLQKLLLGLGSFDLPGGVMLHGLPRLSKMTL